MCATDSVMLCFVHGFESGKEAVCIKNGKEPKLQIVKSKLLRKSR